jgi:putative selenate reductase molybdopterin-binding subunit
LKSYSQYKPPPGVHGDDDKYQGDAYGAYAWAVYVAEVTVDMLTYEVRVDDFVAVQEVGKVVHPVLAAGQIEGGVAQAIGFALTENFLVDANGVMVNPNLRNYRIPTYADIPRTEVLLVETHDSVGPMKAKGIAESNVNPVAPALANALQDATGVRYRDLPFTPERIYRRLNEHSLTPTT